jgi:hypothetical protein
MRRLFFATIVVAVLGGAGAMLAPASGRQQGPVTDREFQIEFLGPGVEAFAFTFG